MILTPVHAELTGRRFVFENRQFYGGVNRKLLIGLRSFQTVRVEGIIQEMGHQILELYFSVIKRSSPKHHSNKVKNSSKNTFWEVSECSRLFSPVFPTDIHDVLQKTVDFLDLVH